MAQSKIINWFIFIGIIVGFTVVTVIAVLEFIDSDMLRIKVVYVMASLLVVTLVLLYGVGSKSRYIPPPSVINLNTESKQVDKHKEDVREEVS